LLSDNNKQIVVDAGSGTLSSLARTGVGYRGVSVILLTHHHIDHVADLLPILKARWLGDKKETKIVGPPGTEALVLELLNVSAFEYLREAITVTTIEIESGEHSVGGFDIRAAETKHSMAGLAYRINDRFTFSSDTEASETVAELADGATVLVHDCSFPDDASVANHASPTALGQILEGRDIDQLYLTHLYPHTDDEHQSMRKNITKSFEGDVAFARDGLSVNIS
jgi:ribonuclease BN (tRNA processing enzyme)